ncbi:AIM24 family protein [Paenibacillus sp. TAB 01]|uniref:AIM24 family protein n=1 Tax=Paenibacillus sp. TAB 01 TaxID=3368988 RepID=UPI00375222E0
MSKTQVLLSKETERTRIEVLGYEQLAGSDDIGSSEILYFLQQSGSRLKQVKVTLNNSSVLLESGALHFMKGHIDVQNNAGGVGGMLKKFISSSLTGESMFKPVYSGSGEIYLEPSFGHYLLLDLKNEQLVADKGMFYACESTISVGVERMKNLSSAIAGGEGLFQTKLAGSGLCVLSSPVPDDEITKIQLNKEKLQVDGNFALLRRGNIQYTVEKSSKSIFGSLTSGEGLLQTFTGTGEVWVAPTQSVYEQLKAHRLGSLIKAGGSSNTKTT